MLISVSEWNLACADELVLTTRLQKLTVNSQDIMLPCLVWSIPWLGRKEAVNLNLCSYLSPPNYRDDF